MTSESRESIPEIPSEIIHEIKGFRPPQPYSSIQKLLEEVREKLNKEIDEDRKIKGEKIEDKKHNQIEFYEEKSVVDFIVNGLGANITDSRRKLPPLKHPKNDNPKNINIFREDAVNNRNPILDFLSKCLPRQTQKPSTNPTQPLIERRRPAQLVR
jgi:hypothetical protein